MIENLRTLDHTYSEPNVLTNLNQSIDRDNLTYQFFDSYSEDVKRLISDSQGYYIDCPYFNSQGEQEKFEDDWIIISRSEGQVRLSKKN
jgi:hypothetical protein